MKLLLLLAALFSLSAITCPNLSGYYEIVSDRSSLQIEIIQTNCEKFRLLTHDASNFSEFTLDGKSYEETFDDSQNSFANKPITPDTVDFSKAYFDGERIVVDSFNAPFGRGTYSTCKDQYSFTSFDCQKYSFSIGFNKSLNSYTWKHVGHWRAQNIPGSNSVSYENEESILRKIR